MELKAIYNDCIDACIRCAGASDLCIAACIEKNDPSLTGCIEVNLQCAVLCNATETLLNISGSYALFLCKQSEICMACAECCELYKEYVEYCADGSAACRTCAEECKKLLEKTQLSH